MELDSQEEIEFSLFFRKKFNSQFIWHCWHIFRSENILFNYICCGQRKFIPVQSTLSLFVSDCFFGLINASVFFMTPVVRGFSLSEDNNIIYSTARA